MAATRHPSRFPCATSLLALLALAAPTSPARAQCEPSFATGTGTAGFWRPGSTAARVEAACLWDPDGAGPARDRLVCAGWFTVAGDVHAPKLASYDLETGAWAPIGNGLADVNGIQCLLPLADGRLVVGGSFTSIDGVAANGIAQWNGSRWRGIGAGPGSGVQRLLQLPNGDLIAARNTQVQRWNGSAWQVLGNGNSDILVLAVAANGDLLVGGNLTTMGGVPVDRIARWDGGAWHALPDLVELQGAAATALLPQANGDLIAAVNYGIQRFDAQSQSWSLLGPAASFYGLSGGFSALYRTPDGDLLAVGHGSPLSGGAGHGVFGWDGVDWQRLGEACNGNVFCALRLPSNDLFVGGLFTRAGTLRCDSAAIWRRSDSSYRPLGRTTDGTVLAVAAAADGSRIAAGDFTTFAGAAANRVARRVGDTWQALGGGVDAEVHAATVLPSGDVVVGGTFQTASGLLARHIARWNGAAWAPLSSGCNWFVHALAVLPDGDLVAGGEFTTAGGVAASRVARWDGSQWHAVGAGIDQRVFALHVLANGDLVAGGEFTSAGGQPAQNIARWDGSQWHAIGGGVPLSVRAVTERPNGDLVAAGIAAWGAPNVLRWDGTVWSDIAAPLTHGSVLALQTLPDGDVVAAGAFAHATIAAQSFVARWDGTDWNGLGTGFDAAAHALALAADGTLLVGGAFTTVGDAVSARFAQRVPTCPATALTYGTGCATAAGTLELSATGLAWLGADAEFAADGVPATAFGLGLTGFAQVSIALATLHPAGGAGCTLLTTPDLVATLLPGAGNAGWTVPIPATPALVGTTFHSQLLTAEFGPSGLQDLAASNALTSTIGSL